MTQNYFVKSKYPRRDGDFYPTIDSRCITALVETLPALKIMSIIDPCAPDGSGIVDSLLAMGISAKGTPDAYDKKLKADFIVTNPPYKLGVVDKIIKAQIDRVADSSSPFIGACMLLRTGFDHAKKYKYLFKDCPFYAGQIKLTFRPRWIEDSKGAPIHNYVWHVWEAGKLTKRLAWVKYW